MYDALIQNCGARAVAASQDTAEPVVKMLSERPPSMGGNEEVYKQASALMVSHASFKLSLARQAAAPAPAAWGQQQAAGRSSPALQQQQLPPPQQQAPPPNPMALEAAWKKLREDVLLSHRHFSALAQVILRGPTAIYERPPPQGPSSSAPPQVLPFSPPFLDECDFAEQALPRLRNLAALDFRAGTVVVDEEFVSAVFSACDAGSVVWEVAECVLNGREGPGAPHYKQLERVVEGAGSAGSGGGSGGGGGGSGGNGLGDLLFLGGGAATASATATALAAAQGTRGQRSIDPFDGDYVPTPLVTVDSSPHVIPPPPIQPPPPGLLQTPLSAALPALAPLPSSKAQSASAVVPPPQSTLPPTSPQTPPVDVFADM